MPPISIPELSTAVAIAFAIGGALFALRRQSNSQTLVLGRDLQSQVDELKSTNRYLVTEMARMERESKAEISELKHENTLLSDQLSLVHEELRDWKRRYDNRTAENDALTRALGNKP